MHDARALLNPEAEAVRKLARRGYHLDLDLVSKLVSQRSAAIQAADSLRNESKRIAEQVRRTAAEGERVSLVERARDLKTRLQEAEKRQRQFDHELHEFMLGVPNLPEDRAPDGDSGDFAVEVRRVGTPPAFDFEPLDHVTLGERSGILDLPRATKLSGPRFAVVRGTAAALERALAQFFLTLHITRHGYTEYSLPALVNPQTMTGTGQLPKFEADLFKTSVADRDLYLIPTAEVPLTNLHAGETLPIESLPLALTSWTPCFRSEAGSYGKDTRGLIRLHQFSKVELVRICDPAESSAELEKMVGHAEACLKELGLAYRVVALAAEDIGFSAQFTYDIEVWLPGQQCYREISSCSDTGTFQARRAGIRTKSKDGTRGFAATLNGSGLPIGRALVAVMEQYQQADGSIRIPDALAPLTGFAAIMPDGTPG
jgi:seryl-tRNA synthetase